MSRAMQAGPGLSVAGSRRTRPSMAGARGLEPRKRVNQRMDSLREEKDVASSDVLYHLTSSGYQVWRPAKRTATATPVCMRPLEGPVTVYVNRRGVAPTFRRGMGPPKPEAPDMEREPASQGLPLPTRMVPHFGPFGGAPWVRDGRPHGALGYPKDRRKLGTCRRLLAACCVCFPDEGGGEHLDNGGRHPYWDTVLNKQGEIETKPEEGDKGSEHGTGGDREKGSTDEDDEWDQEKDGGKKHHYDRARAENWTERELDGVERFWHIYDQIMEKELNKKLEEEEEARFRALFEASSMFNDGLSDDQDTHICLRRTKCIPRRCKIWRDDSGAIIESSSSFSDAEDGAEEEGPKATRAGGGRHTHFQVQDGSNEQESSAPQQGSDAPEEGGEGQARAKSIPRSTLRAGQEGSPDASTAGGRQSQGAPSGGGRQSLGAPPGGGRQSLGAPPGGGRQSQGAPPSGGRQSLGAQPGGGRQSLGAPPGGGRQSLGAPPGGGRQSLGAQPGGGRQSLGAPPGGGRQSLGAPPGGGSQSLGAPPGGGSQSLGAPSGGGRQSLGAPPSGGRQSLGAPPGGGRQSLGAPPGGGSQSLGAPYGGGQQVYPGASYGGGQQGSLAASQGRGSRGYPAPSFASGQGGFPSETCFKECRGVLLPQRTSTRQSETGRKSYGESQEVTVPRKTRRCSVCPRDQQWERSEVCEKNKLCEGEKPIKYQEKEIPKRKRVKEPYCRRKLRRRRGEIPPSCGRRRCIYSNRLTYPLESLPYSASHRHVVCYPDHPDYQEPIPSCPIKKRIPTECQNDCNL